MLSGPRTEWTPNSRLVLQVLWIEILVRKSVHGSEYPQIRRRHGVIMSKDSHSRDLSSPRTDTGQRAPMILHLVEVSGRLQINGAISYCA